jgi:cell division protein FtsW
MRPATPAHILGPRLLFIFTTIALVIFGLVMVYSASFVESFTDPAIQDSSYIFKRQLILVGAGIIALVVTTLIDYRVWNSPVSWIPWAAVVVLLILTWAMGNEELGGKRWFDLFGFNLQPSEFAKIALLLVAGMLLVKLRGASDMTSPLILTAVAIGVPVLFILLQPDLGTTLIALVGIVAVAWFGELSMKPLAIALVAIVVVAAAAVLFAGFRMGRIEAWLDPWAYASNEGYQIVNSFYALADGGVTGVGLGLSHQKYLYLPQPHNDLIFPIIGEELGLIGAAVVAVLFLLFLFSAYRIARNASDLYGRIIAGAGATMIGFQAFLNMLCMVNLLPMTGKPLPFFSAGGSSIIVTLMVAGLILNVSLRSGSEGGAEKRREDLLIIEGGRLDARAGGPVASHGSGSSTGRPARQVAQTQKMRRCPPKPATSQPAKAQASSLRSGRPQSARPQPLRPQPLRPQSARPKAARPQPLRSRPSRSQSSRPLSSTRQARREPSGVLSDKNPARERGGGRVKGQTRKPLSAAQRGSRR